MLKILQVSMQFIMLILHRNVKTHTFKKPSKEMLKNEENEISTEDDNSCRVNS